MKRLGIYISLSICLLIGSLHATWYFATGPVDTYSNNIFVELAMGSPKQNASNALSQFDKILNNELEDEETGEKIDSLSILENAMDNTSNGRNETYIANFKDAPSADQESINGLFGDLINVNLNGEEVDMSILVKRLNLDGQSSGDDNGNEMIVFMTSNTLENTNETADEIRTFTDYYQVLFWERSNNLTFRYALVYCAVFTKFDNSDKWEQIGDMHAGYAFICDYYDGELGSGSFNTDTWRNNAPQYIEDANKSSQCNSPLSGCYITYPAGTRTLEDIFGEDLAKHSS